MDAGSRFDGGGDDDDDADDDADDDDDDDDADDDDADSMPHFIQMIEILMFLLAEVRHLDRRLQGCVRH